MKPFLVLSLPLFILDQATKALVLRWIAPDEMIPVIPGFFNLVQVHNTGAAFGMLKNNNLFFILLSMAAVCILIVLSLRGAFDRPLTASAAALLTAGVLGNLTDRLLHGHVVDFLDFILPWYGRWPAFNVADACICTAAGLFILSSFLDGRERRATQAPAQ